ncbi:MAG: APC family permease [Verrucomicrobiota bacterium]|jgi:amino acid transporter
MKAMTASKDSRSDQPVMVAKTDLRAGALRLPGLLMQCLTHMAPATALLFTIQVTTKNVGLAAPVAYLFAFPIVLVLGVCLMQLARCLPSAGGYYTYISRTVHPRVGFLASWLYFLYDPILAGFILAFMGSVLEKALKAAYNVTFPWWAFLLVAGSFVGWVTYRGVRVSAKSMVVFGAAGVAIALALSLWGFFLPGPGGITFSPFNPANASSRNGLGLAVIFSIFAFNGWECGAPLAEESENPRKNLPRAIFIAILVMGVFLIFGSWGLLVGWGTNDLPRLINSTENPTFVLARRYWGGAWVLVLLALLNSIVAASIAATNAATRVWFGMARSGSLPRALAKVHPRFKTPVNAVRLQIILTFAIGFGLGLWPINLFEFMGNVLTFALILIFSTANLGVFLYYFRQRREEFNLVLHAFFPLVGTLAVLFVAYTSLTPWPAPPVAYAPWVVVAWLALGVLVLIAMKLTGHVDWLDKAGDAIQERPETAEEAEQRSVL